MNITSNWAGNGFLIGQGLIDIHFFAFLPLLRSLDIANTTWRSFVHLSKHLNMYFIKKLKQKISMQPNICYFAKQIQLPDILYLRVSCLCTTVFSVFVCFNYLTISPTLSTHKLNGQIWKLRILHIQKLEKKLTNH